MKSNIINSLMLFAGLAISSCSTQQMVSNAKIEDDVYNTKARAGDVQDMPPPTYRQDVATDEVPMGTDGQYYDSYGSNGSSDYQYYDSYASRIDRFSYSSPFGFYDDYYYTSPYYGGYGYGAGFGYGYGGYGYGGFGLGLGYGYGGFGLGLGYGYGGFGLGLGYGYPFGYGGYYGYSPFGYGYGGYGYGYPYGGIYAAYNRSAARPFRGSGAPGYGGLNNRARNVGYNGNYPGVNNYPGRPVGTNGFGGRSTNSFGGNNGSNTNYGGRVRAPRSDNPGFQQVQPRATNSFPSNNGNFGGGRGGGSAPSGGGGGGGRPGRP